MRFKNSDSNGSQNGTNSQRSGNGNFRNRGQGKGNFKGSLHGKGRGRGRFDKSLNVRCPRIASKTVNKDKMRCRYCNAFGHSSESVQREIGMKKKLDTSMG